MQRQWQPLVGQYTDPVTGNIYTGDFHRFIAGDPTAGMFMTGIYPVFMFGLPAITLAISRTAKPENRAKISGSLISMALTSFLTGVTEHRMESF
ncbi:PTS transporter subunit EIIC [Selenomonas sp. AE3005]|uniref:PTS transporter subunit EIIC n=1 Tax=Selenomonas sp. AE3005 TaxID=1485543 RepID=UPI0025D1CA8B|nr:PTS transporter subunit EIIC [Selenomonas sp. AE3005]